MSTVYSLWHSRPRDGTGARAGLELCSLQAETSGLGSRGSRAKHVIDDGIVQGQGRQPLRPHKQRFGTKFVQEKENLLQQNLIDFFLFIEIELAT